LVFIALRGLEPWSERMVRPDKVAPPVTGDLNRVGELGERRAGRSDRVA
jgi:hypothetical protein